MGFVTRARASETRMAMPPESWAGLAASAPASLTCARAWCARARASGLGTPASSRGRATLASAVAHGIKVGAWNTTELSPRPCASTARPRVGASSPANNLSAVDFPQPEGPISATASPASSSRLNGPSACPRPG